MNDIKIGFFGGVDEFGENLTCYYDKQDGFLVDFGAMFPDFYHHGVTYFYPDYDFILKNYEKFKVLIVTHGHEDHIGGIVNLINRMPLRIIASRFTIALIKKKISFSRKINFYPTFEVAEDLSEYEIGNFNVKFIENDHSIIDSYSLRISNNNVNIFHSSDFKIDENSIKTEKFLKNLNKYCKKTDIALIDSTNANIDYDINLSESDVINSIENIIIESKKNIFITMFSSNIERILNIVNTINKLDFPLVLLGRSIDKYITLAEESDIRINRKNIITITEYNELLNENQNIEEPENLKVIFIIAGSQGELTSALTSISYNQYKGVYINKGDTVIYSSKTIPGNEKDIFKVKNQLLKKGAILKSIKTDDNIHASGHANAEGIIKVLNILQPKNLIPIHGTLFQQKALESIASELKIKKILIPIIGDIFKYSKSNLKRYKNIELDKKFLDITGFDDMDYRLLKKRDNLKLGIAIISLIIDKKDYFVFKRPIIKIEGFVDEKHNKIIMEKVEEVIFKSIEKIDLSKKDLLEIELTLKIKRFFRKNYNISPKLFILVDYI